MTNLLTFQSDRLLVNELFGPTIQGEGPSTGIPCMFLRLAHCNLRCSWCDTKYAWDWAHYNILTEVQPMSITEIVGQLSRQPLRRLVITGGEPLLQADAIHEFALALKHRDHDWQIEIETAGTVKPVTDLRYVHYNVSPKLSNSGNSLVKRYKPDVLRMFEHVVSSTFKFVVCQPSDIDEINAIVEQCDINPEHVILMPEGVSSVVLRDRLHWLVPLAIAYRYRAMTRLQIEAFGNKRGV